MPLDLLRVMLTCLRALLGSLARPRRHPCCRRSGRPHPRTAHPVAPDPPPPAALRLQRDQDLAWEDGAIVLGVSVSRELRGWWQRSRLCSKERKAGLARCPRRQADYELLPFQGPFDGHLEMGRSHGGGHSHRARGGAAALLRGLPASAFLSTSALKHDVGVPDGARPAKIRNCGGQSGERPGKPG